MSSESYSIVSPKRIQYGIIVAVSLLVSSIGILYILDRSPSIEIIQYGSPPYELSLVVDVFNIIASVFLTTALVALYATQANIQGQQRDILELNQKPDLVVNEITAPEGETSTYFEIDIANIGKGAAKDIKTRIKPLTECEGVRFRSSTHHISRNKDDLHVHTERDNFLLPGDSNKYFDMASFNARFEHDIIDNEIKPCSFELVTEELYENGCTTFSFSVSLLYRGPDDEEYIKEVSEFILPIKGRTSLAVAFENGVTRQRLESDPNPPNLELRSENMEMDTGYIRD